MDEYFFLKKNGVKNKKKPYAIITFDDGWADNYIYALDEIYREKLPATIYLTSDFIGTNNLFWPERLFFLLANFSERTVPDQVKLFITKSFRENICKILLDILRQNDFFLKKELTNYLILHLKEYRIKEINNLLSLLSSNQKFGNYDQLSVDRLLTWEEVKEMHSLGISFGSHTRSHAILTNIPIDIAKDEIVHSKEEIEMKTGVPVLDFSYPNGFYNKQLTKLVQDAGYRSAVTGVNSLSNFHADVFALQRKGNNELRLIDHKGELDTAMTLLEWSNFIGFFRGLKKNQYH